MFLVIGFYRLAQDGVRTNYNNTGTSIMEMIYADDYLSPGGSMATATLAEFGAVDKHVRLLDIGSGLGGPAFYLAEQRQCAVQGIDLIEANVLTARQRARQRGLADKVSFVAGDAELLPFAENSFDVVWGQDAWCHVEDKEKLFAEISRVLVDDGKIVFSDWLLGNVNATEIEEVKRITASPNLFNVEMYQQTLTAHGFNIDKFADGATRFVALYRDVLKRLQAQETSLRKQYGDRVFDIVQSKQQFVLGAFESGALGTGSFVATVKG